MHILILCLSPRPRYIPLFYYHVTTEELRFFATELNYSALRIDATYEISLPMKPNAQYIHSTTIALKLWLSQAHDLRPKVSEGNRLDGWFIYVRLNLVYVLHHELQSIGSNTGI